MQLSGQFHAPAALSPGTHWIGDLVSPGGSVDAVAKRKSNPGRPVHSLPTILTEQPHNWYNHQPMTLIIILPIQYYICLQR